MISPREESAPSSKEEALGSEGRQDSAANDLDQVWRQVGTDLASLVDAVRRAVFVEIQRMHLKAVDGFFRGALYLCLLSAGVALSISAALLVASGMQAALATWSGLAWLSNLVAGFVILLTVWFSGLAIRSALRGHILRNTEKRLATGSAASAHGDSKGGAR